MDMQDEYMTEEEFLGFEEAVQVKANCIMYLLARSIQAGQLDVTQATIRKSNPSWTDAEVASTFSTYQTMLKLTPAEIAQTVRVCRKRLNDLGLDPVDEWSH